MKIGKILYILVVILLIGIFVVSGIYVAGYFYESNRQQAQYDDLAAIVESARDSAGAENPTRPTMETIPATDPSTGEILENQDPVILPEYQTLYEMNNHLVGWIKIEDTNVNYPVMQTPEEPDFYLYRNFNGQNSSRGCIYVREECDVFAPSDNLTIYGHHMRDGSMFQNLHKYQRKSFWETHDTIIFDTLYEHHTYQIFAVFKTTASIGEGFTYHRFIDAADQAEFDEFIATCKELAFYDTGITPEYGDKIICLSTCEYSQPNGRFVVVAVRVS